MSAGAVNSGKSFWDNPDIKYSEYAQFKEDGDFIEGKVTALDIHTFEANDRGPERKVPKLTLARDGQMVELTCGPADLRKKVEKARPEVGDDIRIEQVAHTETSFGTTRFFTVRVTKPQTVVQQPFTVPTASYGQQKAAEWQAAKDAASAQQATAQAAYAADPPF